MNAEGLSELALVSSSSSMSERKGRAAACSYKGLKNIFYFVLCLGVFLWAFALFSYNSFLFIFFLSVFFCCFVCVGNNLSIF